MRICVLLGDSNNVQRNCKVMLCSSSTGKCKWEGCGGVHSALPLPICELTATSCLLQSAVSWYQFLLLPKKRTGPEARNHSIPGCASQSGSCWQPSGQTLDEVMPKWRQDNHWAEGGPAQASQSLGSTLEAVYRAWGHHGALHRPWMATSVHLQSARPSSSAMCKSCFLCVP